MVTDFGKISVIIPTSNRNELLFSLLPRYISQPHTCEIIIVDDASRIPVAETLKPILEKSEIPIRVIRLEVPSYQPVARNTGIMASKGDYIFMGEDDAYPEPDHFDKLLKEATRYGWQVIAGRLIDIWPGQTEEHAIRRANREGSKVFAKFLLEAYFDRKIESPLEVPFLHTNALIRREVFNISLYDPLFANKISFREETDFYLSLHKRGVRLGLVPNTFIFHLRGAVKRGGGIYQVSWLRKEFLIWLNELRFERKHKDYFIKRFGILGHPLIRFPLFLTRRYPIALYRRFLWALERWRHI